MVRLARKPRVWFPGASFHITSRGNRRASIFYDQDDRLMYLSLLEETRLQYPFHLHAYCLMTNHIHLLLETIDTPTKDIIKKLHSLYAIYFNRRHRISGHLFQGRYHAELIDNNPYFLEVSKYIHLNPVEARMVARPGSYRWSSYNAYILQNNNPHVVTERILAYFPSPQKHHYQKYVEQK
ncbi:REP element-mobilizing transposase RayT [Halalkalibacter nanhaiisediminis]|uniref:REP element-mobilizing transposase RayT n=1 Tax=Halalkalibacter nanhaiisediminis TaxID=688079 RepID=A0A562QT42_9BACI|nr:REP element-mobilizing transposase RayT [Halalkalibacter nanhaiisediminis]